MERELILAVKSTEWNQQKIDAEVRLMKKIIPYLESFEAFAINNEVFDLYRHKAITGQRRLFGVHKNGVDHKELSFIFCKN